VENYREKLKDIVYVDTFSSLILKYDQMQGYSANMDTSFIDTEEDTPGRSQVSGGRRWQGVKDLDAAEEEYFNTSDDEDEKPEVSGKMTGSRAAINGASPLSKPLVDYPSDEEGEMMDTEMSAEILPDKVKTERSAKAKEEGVDGTPSSSPTPPLERLSEKRRREEDEEDELGKLSHQQPKRRSSTSSTSSVGSVSSNTSNIIKRKKSFNNARDGNTTTPRKIAISLAPAIKSGGEGNKGAEDGS